MTHREVELLAIGAGPANLALAVALEESGYDDLAEGALLIEAKRTVQWQQGLLLPWAKTQVSFMKDLVTLRDPQSEFTFLSFLQSTGRLNDFVNLGSVSPFRIEISEYLAWVARSLTKVQMRLGCHCESVEHVRDSGGKLTGWLARLADGSTVSSRYLVIGIGREPYIPPALAGLPPDRLIHSTQYRPRVASLTREFPYRVAVIGGAQSSAEMFRALADDLPDGDITWIMRSIGPRPYDLNKFINEFFYPSFVDEFFACSPQGRDQILQEMHLTNYSAVEPDLLEVLYQGLYLDRLAGNNRRRLRAMTEIRAARAAGGEAVLELIDRSSGAISELRRDLIFLGTGFRRQMPALVRDLCAKLGLRAVEVTREYRLILDEPSDAACYLQGVNEASHGIADSLLSVLAHRGGEIVQDIARLAYQRDVAAKS